MCTYEYVITISMSSRSFINQTVRYRFINEYYYQVKVSSLQEMDSTAKSKSNLKFKKKKKLFQEIL